ncbi:hypothetical protein [Rhodothermus profundi]|uniref:Uncharacterized protein n=1 Tax=Rhodothermus profundi TaxID=633813 RepID=A0A1M6X7L5_9BACT|nr:hypothetical protein [Rhodothermus profundi]SHL01775.1 hypothetical protein SAMN04488087_2529 [Rhodothermus profundi]
MNLRIPSWPSFLKTPEPNAAQRPDASPSPPRSKAQPAPSAPQETRPEGVTRDEWAWIQRHFPPSEKMTLRLYGPNRSLQTLQPGGLGMQLDVKG